MPCILHLHSGGMRKKNLCPIKRVQSCVRNETGALFPCLQREAGATLHGGWVEAPGKESTFGCFWPPLRPTYSLKWPLAVARAERGSKYTRRVLLQATALSLPFARQNLTPAACQEMSGTVSMWDVDIDSDMAWTDLILQVASALYHARHCPTRCALTLTTSMEWMAFLFFFFPLFSLPDRSGPFVTMAYDDGGPES